MNKLAKRCIEGCGTLCSAPFSHWYGILLAVFLSAQTVPGSADDIRALWVVRDSITSPEAVRQVVEFAAAHDFNLLFVQVRGRGDAYYRSYFVPGPEAYPQIPDTFDPLSYIIELAHAKGIEVHAWFNVYLAASMQIPPVDPEHPFNAHPSWFMISADGLNMATAPFDAFGDENLEGAYLSPGQEEVREYLARVITEVAVTYDIDGVHLDYVRYPGREFDFSDTVRKRFSTVYGVDPVVLYREGDKVDPTLKLLEEWSRFRVEPIDDLVRGISLRLKMIGRPLRLSAAVKPDYIDAYYEFGQNWTGWLRENIVDFVVPMCYFPETGQVENSLTGLPADIDRKRIVGGLGAYKLTPELLTEQIALTKKLGLDGYCVFSYSDLAGNAGFDQALK